ARLPAQVAACGGTGERRSPPAASHQPQRILPRQEGRQDQSRRVVARCAADATRARRGALRSRLTSSMRVTIAVDAMGGDHGPPVTVAASLRFLEELPDARVILVGREDEV